MKKVLLSLAVLLALSLCGVLWLNRVIYDTHRNMFDGQSNQHVYINVSTKKPSVPAERLKVALENEGKKVTLSYQGEHKSGDLNIYTAEDVYNLSKVLDSKAINFLWLDKMADNKDPEILRPFDVVITKSMPLFNHLKAINVRTAFIPNSIDITPNKPSANGRAMFLGDGEVYSLALSLAGQAQMSLDVYGKNFEGKWPTDEIKAERPTPSDMGEYSLVLVDQEEANIRDEFIEPLIITILENGGLPFIRYNPAVEKLFGEAVPMYYNGDEFKPKLEFLLAHPQEIMERKEAIRNIAQGWSSKGQAKKFIELFEVMEKKRR